MTTWTTTRIEILGTLRGDIWMPCEECTKDVHAKYNVPRDRFTDTHTLDSWPGSVRDALCDITNDGDFRAARLEDGATLKVTRYNPQTRTTRTRYRELATDGDNADCFVSW